MVLMVFAVNIAPQVPLPGITFRSTSSNSSRLIRSARIAARASAQSRIVRLLPFDAHGSKFTQPGELVPG